MNIKKLKKIIVLLLFVSGIISLTGCKLGVQKMVAKHYENKQGLIQNYAKKEKVEYLSESIGQYLNYLVMVKDAKEFERQVGILEEHFFVKDTNQLFIKWRVTQSTTVNASIDDFRIIESLKAASHEFNEPTYLDLANQLEETILSNQLTNGLVVDFYDWKLKKKTNTVHLSYLNDQIIKENEALDDKLYQKIMIESPDSTNPFFNEIYNVEEENYQTANKRSINMIDQLLIAVNYIKLTNQVPHRFDQWLKNEWDTNKRLAGGYNKSTLTPAVSYESSSVYSIALLYFMTANEADYAKQIHAVLLKQPLFENQVNDKNIHFFDYIWAKTSDWEYKNKN